MKEDEDKCDCGKLWLFIYACGFTLGVVVMLAKG